MDMANDTDIDGTQPVVEPTPPLIDGNYLKIAEHGRSSRTRALRLKIEDIIVAVDGTEFNANSDTLVDLLSSEDNGQWLLTICRNGALFEVFTRGPIGGILEFTKDHETEAVKKLLENYTFHDKSEYRIFEVLKNLNKKCDVYDTSFSQTAVFLPPIWLLQNRMWEPLLAVMSVYLITFNVNIGLFIISTFLLAVYFKQGQVTLRRSYSMFQDYQMWAVVAAKDEATVQQVCRNFDPKCDFVKSLVGPPEKEEEKTKKRKRKSGNLSQAIPQNY